MLIIEVDRGLIIEFDRDVPHIQPLAVGPLRPQRSDFRVFDGASIPRPGTRGLFSPFGHRKSVLTATKRGTLPIDSVSAVILTAKITVTELTYAQAARRLYSRLALR
jgi:hypothetical protein